MPKYKNIAVTFTVSEKEQKALEELLPSWHKYKNEDGEEPFKDHTIDELLDSIMQPGSGHYISKKIKEEQFRQGMIGSEELINDKPFRLMAERQEA